jgi:hypothetical protein
MSLTATTIFDLIAPQYKDNTDKSNWLLMASDELSSCFYGKKYNRAVALYAAHLMAVSLRPGGSSGDAGTVSSKKEGDLSISYSNVGDIRDADLGQTSYGRQLMALKKKANVGGIGVTGGLDNGCIGTFPTGRSF